MISPDELRRLQPTTPVSVAAGELLGLLDRVEVAAQLCDYAAEIQKRTIMDTDEDRELNARVVETLRNGANAARTYLAAVST